MCTYKSTVVHTLNQSKEALGGKHLMPYVAKNTPLHERIRTTSINTYACIQIFMKENIHHIQATARTLFQDDFRMTESLVRDVGGWISVWSRPSRFLHGTCMDQYHTYINTYIHMQIHILQEISFMEALRMLRWI
jgi:hypothetical protein